MEVLNGESLLNFKNIGCLLVLNCSKAAKDILFAVKQRSFSKDESSVQFLTPLFIASSVSFSSY